MILENKFKVRNINALWVTYLWIKYKNVKYLDHILAYIRYLMAYLNSMYYDNIIIKIKNNWEKINDIK